jgi:pyruvate dehydrogenase complex dehydrogenase (E1) component
VAIIFDANATTLELGGDIASFQSAATLCGRAVHSFHA